MNMEAMAQEAEAVLSACVKELKEAGQLPAGSLVVLGCSTSEVAGARIGKGSVGQYNRPHRLNWSRGRLRYFLSRIVA